MRILANDADESLRRMGRAKRLRTSLRSLFAKPIAMMFDDARRVVDGFRSASALRASPPLYPSCELTVVPPENAVARDAMAKATIKTYIGDSVTPKVPISQ